MAYRKVNDDSLASVANAIRTKGGTTEPLAFPDGFVSAISAIQAGGGGSTTPSAKWGDVTFIDYDGSVLYSYSLSEAQALTELPPLPEHDGLICQGWNWSLQSIKALNREVTVGAMYITDDGATRLHIRIATVGRMDVPLYIGQTVANGVTIDWGDGSDAQTLAGTGNVNTTHTYAQPGDYTISLMPEDGCTLSLGQNASNYCVLGGNGPYSLLYCKMLITVFVGKNVTSIGKYSFNQCSNLENISIPASVSSIGESAFSVCSSLVAITIPDGVISILSSTFQNCYSISCIAIPASITSFESNSFFNCYSMNSITLPNGLTSIKDYALYLCGAIAIIKFPESITYIGNYALNSLKFIRYYDFSACKSVPTLSSTNAFTGIQSDCKMLIPSALFDEWSAATNWATYAKYMVAV